MKEGPRQYLVKSDTILQEVAQSRWNTTTHNAFEYQRRGGQHKHRIYYEQQNLKGELKDEGQEVISFCPQNPWQTQKTKLSQNKSAEHATYR